MKTFVLIWLFMHRFTMSVQSITSLCTLIRIRSQLKIFFRRNIVRTARKESVPLYRVRYTSALHYIPFYLETLDAVSISLSVIMRNHKRACIVSSMWNLSAIGSWYVRKNYHWFVLLFGNWSKTCNARYFMLDE